MQLSAMLLQAFLHVNCLIRALLESICYKRIFSLKTLKNIKIKNKVKCKYDLMNRDIN